MDSGRGQPTTGSSLPLFECSGQQRRGGLSQYRTSDWEYRVREHVCQNVTTARCFVSMVDLVYN